MNKNPYNTSYFLSHLRARYHANAKHRAFIVDGGFENEEALLAERDATSKTILVAAGLYACEVGLEYSEVISYIEN